VTTAALIAAVTTDSHQVGVFSLDSDRNKVSRKRGTKLSRNPNNAEEI